MADNFFKLDKTAILVHKLGEEPKDLKYWFSWSAAERLAAIELMRQINYKYDPVADRIPRVLEVVQNPWC